MTLRISPLWWPFLAAASPVLLPFLIARNSRFRKNVLTADTLNRQRIDCARSFDLPELDFLEMTVLVEEKAEEGFLGDAGVSCLFRSDLGTLLFDVGFGPERPALAHNCARLSVTLDSMDALCISHLHPDHMGGISATRTNQVMLPDEMGTPNGKPCFLPDDADAPGFTSERMDAPGLLSAGIATTGPLARSLFFFGLTEEQALFARVRNKGLVIFTGCRHPTIERIVQMVRQVSTEPIHAIGGGLHFPITGGRGNRAGIQFQTILGTGKPVWQRINKDDLNRTIDSINVFDPSKVYLSAHDTCDFSLTMMQEKIRAETEVLKAGMTYRF